MAPTAFRSAVTVLFAAAALLTPIAAQSAITTSLFIPEADSQALVASVVGVKGSTTTYAIGCPAGSDSASCGFPSPWLMTYGPGFYDAQTTQSGAFTESDHCSLQGTTGAVCTINLAGSEANDPGVTTTTLVASDMTPLPVTITAGLEKLSGGASQTAGSQTGSSGSSVTATPTSTGSATKSASSSSSGSATPQKTNGAAVIGMETGLSLLAVIGAALPALVL